MTRKRRTYAFAVLIPLVALLGCSKKDDWQPSKKDPIQYYRLLSSPPPELPRTKIVEVSDVTGGFGALGVEPDVKVIDCRFHRTVVFDVSQRTDPSLNLRTRPGMVADEYAYHIRERAQQHGFSYGSSHASAHGKVAHSSDGLAIVVTGCWLSPDNPNLVQIEELHLAWGFTYRPKLDCEKELANKTDAGDGQ